ncbi:uncharacterized protein LOC143360857 [Halictus rubicundus]|uniref:uncharacterized protein LOC143360857 n=1 Tax=Halictus rubicundus TaxID=77578 RepID=UPI0040365917
MMEERIEAVSEEIVKREKKKQQGERWEKIGRARYNMWYGRVKGEGIPGYLKKGWGESRWQRVARYRLGNDMRGGKYWLEEEKKVCRVCGWEEETWEHVWEMCIGGDEGRGWQGMVGEVLGDEGEGQEWMRKVDEWRKSMNGRGMGEEV